MTIEPRRTAAERRWQDAARYSDIARVALDAVLALVEHRICETNHRTKEWRRVR